MLWLAAGFALLYLAGLSAYLFAVIPHPYPTHFEEGVILNAALALARGGNIYPDNSSPPFLATIYTPLHYLLFSVPAAVLGPNLVAPRLISLLSTLLLALVVYRWVAWRGSDRRMALFAPGILLTFFPVANWAAAARADTTAVLLSMTAAYLVDRHFQDRRLWLAIPLMALAFYTKQSQLASPAAAALFLMMVAPSRALRFGMAYLAAVAVPFLAIDLITGHGLYQHVFDYGRAQPPWIWRAKQMLKAYMVSYAGYLLLAISGAAALMRAGRVPFLALYLATSFLGAVSVLASGSDFNHFMENAAVLSVAAGIGLARAVSSKATALRMGCVALLAAQLALRVPSTVPWLPAPWLAMPDGEGRGVGVSEPPLWLGIPAPEARRTGDRLVEELAAARGPVLSELTAFAVLAGRPSVLDDSFMFTALARLGKWAQEPVLQQLETGEIALVALLVDVRAPGVHHTRLTDEMIGAIRDRYRLVERLPFPGLEGPFFYLYRPAEPDRPAAAETAASSSPGAPTLEQAAFHRGSSR